jgi:hypothetical protein
LLKETRYPVAADAELVARLVAELVADLFARLVADLFAEEVAVTHIS